LTPACTFLVYILVEMKYVNRTNKTIYLPSGMVFRPFEEKILQKEIPIIKGIDVVLQKKKRASTFVKKKSVKQVKPKKENKIKSDGAQQKEKTKERTSE